MSYVLRINRRAAGSTSWQEVNFGEDRERAIQMYEECAEDCGWNDYQLVLRTDVLIAERCGWPKGTKQGWFI